MKNINNLTFEELMYILFRERNQFLTPNDIKNKLIDYHISYEKIKEYIEVLDDNKFLINIDSFYQNNYSKRNFKLLPDYEKIRYIVRNTFINSEYGNFHNIEYKYLIGMIVNQLKKIGLPKKIIEECISYINFYPNELYDGDRYIIKKYSKNKHNKIIFHKKIYKAKNIYIVYNNNCMYYCTKTLLYKNKEIEFLDKKYYKDINYEYYNILTNQFICDSNNNEYNIICLCDLDDKEFNDSIIPKSIFNEMINIKYKVKK